MTPAKPAAAGQNRADAPGSPLTEGSTLTAALQPTDGKQASVGVYVHFPYCLKKCPYCDFLSVATERADVPHQAYADAVISELGRRTTELGSRRLGSIFFGGGTPSLWHPTQLGRVLEAIVDAFGARPADVEITAECNPSSFDDEVAAGLKSVGVNRVSLGVQGLDDQRLAFLGRLHSTREGLRAIERALAQSFERVSADLIFGVAGQSAVAAAAEVRTVAATGLTHVSAYSLTIEPGTQFGALHQKGRLPLLSESMAAESFSAVHDALEGAGFTHYEISNFARDGHVAAHNLGYWRGQDYVGLGAGAWGTYRRGSGDRVRYRNTPSPERYVTSTKEWTTTDLWTVSSLIRELEPIDSDTYIRERLMLGLRLAEGVDVERLAEETATDVLTPERRRSVDKLSSRGRLRLEGARLSIPHDAWLFADDTLAQLI